MYCTPEATVSLQNVKPGLHHLEVVPALNDHAEVMSGGQQLSFDYEPTSPLPDITDTANPGKPTIEIVSPENGATLSGPFDVVIRTTNWHNSCGLLGKPDVAGYGHWHVNVDTTNGGMMGMATMLGMSCTTVLHTSTIGLLAGSHHTLIALLV